MSCKQSRRIITSAISSMSVAEVRRSLCYLRKKWEDSEEHDFFLVDALCDNGLSIQDFSLKFVLGHHEKRHRKNDEECVAKNGG